MNPSDASVTSAARFQVGEWLVDPAANVLRRGDETRHLRAKAMELLLLLIERKNETVSREEIVEKIWAGNEAVAAQGINNAIWSIRQVLDDEADAPRYLLTVPKKGYRLIADVRPLQASVATELPRATEQPETAHTEPRSTQPPTHLVNTRPARGWWAMVFVVLVVVAATIAWQLSERTPVLHPVATRALTSYPGMEYLGQLSPDGKLLAFAWWQNTGKGIAYLRKPEDEAAELVRISEVNFDVTGLSWSGDSNRLAYIALDDRSDCRVALYSLQTRRTEYIGGCFAAWTPTLAWSPTQDQLVYTARLPDQDLPGLVLHDLTTGQIRQLTTNDGNLPDHQPAWSPDGDAIAFVRSDKVTGNRDIFVSDMQGRVRQISHAQLQDVHGLTWHHAGETVIYSTTLHGSRVLWQLDLATGSRTPLGLEGSAPQAHSSGLLYSLLKKHQRLGKLTFEPGRGRLQPLAGGVSSEQTPDFSRAEQALVFVSARTGHRELWRTDPNGQHPRQLTDAKRLVQRPRWSPDGKTIAFVGVCEAERHGLCLLDVATGKVMTLNSQADDFQTPVWRDDGLALYVVAQIQNRNVLWQVARENGRWQELAVAEEPTLLQKRFGEATLHYLSRDHRQLRQFDPETGKDQRPALAEGWPQNVVAWQLLRHGVVTMQRDQSETWQYRRTDQEGWQIWAEFPLGTFAEFPAISQAGDDNVLYVELADTGYADLMFAPN